MNFTELLLLGHCSIISALSVIHMSHFFHSLLISSDLINLILFPKKLYFDRKNKVEDFALPYSSIPTMVKLISGFSYISLFKSVITAG